MKSGAWNQFYIKDHYTNWNSKIDIIKQFPITIQSISKSTNNQLALKPMPKWTFKKVNQTTKYHPKLGKGHQPITITNPKHSRPVTRCLFYNPPYYFLCDRPSDHHNIFKNILSGLILALKCLNSNHRACKDRFLLNTVKNYHYPFQTDINSY
jgi:hypothetical protein